MKRLISIAVMVLMGAVNGLGTAEIVRDPVVAGTFYPEDSASLARLVQEHLTGVADPQIEGELVALIVPHAGLTYSGRIAAHAYHQLEKRDINTVVLCGPSHRYRFDGASVYGPDVLWRTPLGTVACDNDIARALINHNQGIQVVRDAHAQEHAIEVQLPYLQEVLENLAIVPVTVGTENDAGMEQLIDALAAVSREKDVVLIASTDWQHYRPASTGHVMDSLGMACLTDLDPDRLQRYLASQEVEMCGAAPTLAVINAAMRNGADRVKILAYGDSGDITGDKASVVGYVAAALYKSTPSPPDLSTGPDDAAYHLTDDEKQQLLDIARESIEHYVSSAHVQTYDVTGKLAQPGAAFVTLERDGRLRGCIGRTIPEDPLYKTVSYCAVQAAVADPRFPAVSPDELGDLDISISVLTPLQEVPSLSDITVGRDGLMITLGNARGLLLPQVATEYGWDRNEFLRQTCRKAGLPFDAYLDDEAVIQTFQALVFSEKD